MESEVLKSEKLISIKPIIRKGWLPEGHDGEYRFTGTEVVIQAQIEPSTRQIKTGLTESDERRLEKALHLSEGTLNRYNKDFWGGVQGIFRIPKNGKTYDLSNPKDELEYKVIKSWSGVAPSKSVVNDCPGAIFYLSNIEEEASLKNKKLTVKLKSSKIFSNLSQEDVFNVLKVYSLLQGKNSGKVTKSTSFNIASANLFERMENDPEEFIRIYEDEDFKIKVLIDDLVSNRILMKSGSKYVIAGGDTIGVTLEQTIDYIKDPRNQDVKLELMKKLSAQTE